MPLSHVMARLSAWFKQACHRSQILDHSIIRTRLCLINSSILANWISPFPVKGMSGEFLLPCLF